VNFVESVFGINSDESCECRGLLGRMREAGDDLEKFFAADARLNDLAMKAHARTGRPPLRLVAPDPGETPRSEYGGLDQGAIVPFAALAEEGRRLLAEGVPYVVEGLIPDLGMAGFMVAPPKVGKSTLGLLMACAVARGDHAFLGRRVRQKRTLYLALEDPREYLAVMIAQATKGGEDAAAYSGYLPLESSTMDRIGAEVEAGKYAFVYVATWTSWLAGAVKDENDNAGVARAAGMVKQLARWTGVPFLLEAHAGKGDDGGADADPVKMLRGASAGAGEIDYVLALRRHGPGGFTTKRTLRGLGRFVNSPPLTYDFDLATGELTLLAEGGKASVETDRLLLLETGAITTEPRSLSAIARAAGWAGASGETNAAIRARVRLAVKGWDAVRIETTKRANKVEDMRVSLAVEGAE
jgi:hypothetical protein